jgi:carboxyl-terminal processing protease
MTTRKQKIALSAFTIIVLVFGCFKRTDGLKQSDIKPLASIFLAKHVRYHSIDADISRRTVANLVNSIDPGKYYFYKNDIAGLAAFEGKIGDMIESGAYDPVFNIFVLYKKRFAETMDLMEELLKLEYDFTKDESIIVDSDKIDYPATPGEMKERWRKNIKLQLLNYLSAVKDIGEAKEKLRNKYRITKKRVDEIDSERMIAIFINSFSTALDPHSNYLTQEEHEDFMISTKLKLEGIGVLLRSEDGFVIVESIIPGGAAAKLPAEMQLRPNDEIVAVAQGEDESVDVIDWDLREVVKLIRGKTGKVVKLSILRKTGENNKQVRMVIPIVREEIKLEDRAAKSDVHRVKRQGSAITIGYVKLPSFYLDFDAVQRNDPKAKSSSRDMILQINKMKSLRIDGMVLDLRGNPGGALTEAVDLAGLFIDQGPVVKIKDGDNRTEVMSDEDPGIYYDGPLVVLVDKFSASASEIFAGAIKDYRRGILLGPGPTFGKGSVQTYNPLPAKKGAVKITTALFYQPGGTSNQLSGILPDILVPDISSVWEIGEDRLRYPIKWERIRSETFIPYRNYVTEGVVGTLRRNSSARIANSKEYAGLAEKILSLRTKLQSKEISLKEESVIEKHRMEDIERQREKGDGEKLIDLENDLFLKEAFDITADYIDLVK